MYKGNTEKKTVEETLLYSICAHWETSGDNPRPTSLLALYFPLLMISSISKDLNTIFYTNDSNSYPEFHCSLEIMVSQQQNFINIFLMFPSPFCLNEIWLCLDDTAALPLK